MAVAADGSNAFCLLDIGNEGKAAEAVEEEMAEARVAKDSDMDSDYLYTRSSCCSPTSLRHRLHVREAHAPLTIRPWAISPSRPPLGSPSSPAAPGTSTYP